MAIQKPQLDTLIEEQEKDSSKKKVSPVFITSPNPYKSIPGKTDKQKIVYLLLKIGWAPEKIATAFKRSLSESTIRRWQESGF